MRKIDVPAIGPFHIYQVLSDSMVPFIFTDDVIIVAKTEPEQLIINDVITFYAFESNTVITHRIIEIVNTENGFGFRTQGDNNNTADSFITPKDRVIGKYVARIPKLKAFLDTANQKPYLVILFTAAVILVQLLGTKAENALKRKKRKRPNNSRNQKMNRSKAGKRNKNRNEIVHINKNQGKIAQ